MENLQQSGSGFRRPDLLRGHIQQTGLRYNNGVRRYPAYAPVFGNVPIKIVAKKNSTMPHNQRTLVTNNEICTAQPYKYCSVLFYTLCIILYGYCSLVSRMYHTFICSRIHHVAAGCAVSSRIGKIRKDKSDGDYENNKKTGRTGFFGLKSGKMKNIICRSDDAEDNFT